MATTAGTATASNKYRHLLRQKPVDTWSLKERLMLASAVLQSGDQNWVSVSRAIRNQVDQPRPPEWFSQKNCALQYEDLLEKAETPKRKRADKNEVVETPGAQIVRKLTLERMEELKEQIKKTKEQYKKLKTEIEMVNSGHCDVQLAEIWEQIQKRQREKEENQRAAEQEEESQKQLLSAKALSSGAFEDSSTQDSVLSHNEYIEVDEEATDFQSSLNNIQEVSLPVSSPGSAEPLKGCDVQTAVDTEAGLEPLTGFSHSVGRKKQEAIPTFKKLLSILEIPASSVQPSLATEPTAVVNPPVKSADPASATPVRSTTPAMAVPVRAAAPASISPIRMSLPAVADPVKSTNPAVTSQTTPHPVDEQEVSIRATFLADHTAVVEPAIGTPAIAEVHAEALPSASATDEQESSLPEDKYAKTISSVSDDDNTQIASPSSSVSSHGEDSNGHQVTRSEPTQSEVSSVNRHARGSRGHKKNDDTKEDTSSQNIALGTRAPAHESEPSSRALASELYSSDDEGSQSHRAHLDSTPSSPSSMSQCETEEDKAHKSWKKSIMLVWRAAANHKYANVFMNQVTDDIAPGYSSCVLRPMSLTMIKRNLESNQIRSTEEFQRDMMLVFINAIMYNNSEHDVYNMAQAMFSDILRHIEQFINTQAIVKEQESKAVSLRGRRTDPSQKDSSSERTRRGGSIDQDQPTVKKRKMRIDS